MVLNLFWSRPPFCLQKNLRHHQNYYMPKVQYCFFLRHCTAYYHGRRKNFFQGRVAMGFFQNFSRGAKSGKISFFPTRNKEKKIFARVLKLQGPAHPASLPRSIHTMWYELPMHKAYSNSLRCPITSLRGALRLMLVTYVWFEVLV